MSEIKEEVSRMTNEERQELGAFLAIQSRIHDEEWLDEIDERFADMKAGNAVSAGEAVARHERPQAEDK